MGQGIWMRSLGSPLAGVSGTSRDKAVNIFKGESSDDMLDASSIKYIVVPLRDVQNEDDFFQYYGDDRDYYIDALDSASYLQRIDIGASNIVVYENKDFRPHVSAFRAAQSVDVSPGELVENYHSFVTKQMQADLNFYVRDKSRGVAFPATRVDDIFSRLNTGDIKEGGVSKNFPGADNPVLYYDPEKSEINYDIRNGLLSLTATPYSQLQVNGKKLENSANPRTLAQRQLAPATEHYLQSGEQIKPLTASPQARGTVGTSDKPLAVYAAAAPNKLVNGSFEKGLWQKQVTDCNAYDREAVISAEHDSFVTQGKRSLRLDAQRHTACMAAEPVDNSHQYYLISFDHYVEGGQTVGYEVNFDDKQVSKIRQDIRGTRKWQKEQLIIEAPRNARSLQLTLKGYPDYRQVKYAATYFDDVRIVPLNKVIDIPATDREYKKIPLPSDTSLAFSYAKPGLNTDTNVLMNGDFSRGLWQKKVADCNNFDDNPVIGMKLIDYDEGKALELSAKRHAACTSRTDIPVNESSSYLLGFKYQTANSKKADYSIQFNDAKQTILTGSIDVKTKRWQEFAKQIDTPLGATKMALTVYSYGTDAGDITVINRYADFSLRQLPARSNSFFLVNDSATQNKLPSGISHTYISTTKTAIHAAGATAPFFIGLSNSYNPLWRLSLTSEAVHGGLNKYLPWVYKAAVSEKDHFSLNDFQNGWYIDPAKICKSSPEGCARNPDGSYDIYMVAEFVPQRWFYVSATASGAVAIVCLAFLLYQPIRRKRHLKAKKIWRAVR